MMEDNTAMFVKPMDTKRESTIFNTSVRGWIALVLSLILSLCVVMVVVAPFFKVQIPEGTSAPLVTLFISGFTAAITHYFQQGSKEGQHLVPK